MYFILVIYSSVDVVGVLCLSIFVFTIKMKRKVLSLLEKCEILKSLDNGSSVTYLSKKYGIAKSTVCAIKNKKRDILKVTSKRSEMQKRKTLKSCKMPRMEKKYIHGFVHKDLKMYRFRLNF